jgi:hypothetical protein
MDLLKSGESSERNDIMDPILVGVLFNKRKTNLGRTATGARQLLQMGSQTRTTFTSGNFEVFCSLIPASRFNHINRIYYIQDTAVRNFNGIRSKDSFDFNFKGPSVVHYVFLLEYIPTAP